MEITIKEQDGRFVAALKGDLSNATSAQAIKSLEPLYERNDCDIVIDCTELEYISSSGLRILLNIFKHTRSHDHTTILKGMNDEIADIFDISGFLQLFTIEK